jgi:aminoglycoside phosphotransferase (APT) family kinase protein
VQIPEPGALVGTGRSADVFELGDAKVLRRYREPRDTEREVATMEYARQHGYPVPAARALSDTEIAMERVTGPSMLADMGHRPWRVRPHARTLALLHRRLHSIPPPDWLEAPFGKGDLFLHLDLHPDNVLLGEKGPVVIDWPNAAKGPPEVDVAHTLLVLKLASVPGGVVQRMVSTVGRSGFIALFLGQFDKARVTAAVPAAARFRIERRNLPEEERNAIQALLR